MSIEYPPYFVPCEIHIPSYTFEFPPSIIQSYDSDEQKILIRCDISIPTDIHL